MVHDGHDAQERLVAMLVLSRKEGDSITTSNGVVVTICKIDNNRVVVGIDADSSVRIARSELLENKAVFNVEEANGFSGKTQSPPVLIAHGGDKIRDIN